MKEGFGGAMIGWIFFGGAMIGWIFEGGAAGLDCDGRTGLGTGVMMGSAEDSAGWIGADGLGGVMG